MNPFGPWLRRGVLAVGASALLLALGAALVRLLPWLLDARIGWATAAVFARTLVAVSVEAAVTVALPLGTALAVAAFQDRGEARACLLAGASPGWLLGRAAGLAVGVALVGGVAGQAAASEGAQPGAVVRGLIEAARRGAPERAVSEVPGLGASWLGQPGEEPWLVLTPVPGVVVQARRASVDDEAREARLEQTRWTMRGPPRVELEVDEVTVRGAVMPARSPWAPRWSRWGQAIAALAGAYALGWSLLAAGSTSRLLATGLGVLTALGPLWLRGAVDGGQVSWVWGLGQPALAVAPTAIWWGLGRAKLARMRA